MDEQNELWQRIADDLRKHHDSSGSSDLTHGIDLGVLEAIRSWLSGGGIKVSHGNQVYFNLLQSLYPIGLNRIDWCGVQPHQEIDILTWQDRQTVLVNDELEKLKSAQNILDAWLREAQSDYNSPIVWTGDGCDLSLEITPLVFLECYPQLFTSGQDSYVIPPSCEWCINYTLESKLYFGYSSDAVATGYVDLDSIPDE